MRKSRKRLVLLSLVAASGLLTGWNPAPAAPAGSEGTEVRLTVFYPSKGTIQDLLALRQAGALDIPGLSVVGVYHNLEKTDYGQAEAFLREQNIDWMTLRPISTRVRPLAIYERNAWTVEFERIVDESDGVIFFGGPDIPPSLYDSPQNLQTQIEDLHRHYFEVSAAFHFLGSSRKRNFKPLLQGRPGFPVLGICLGMQTINVAAGGTLVQDIWSETYKVKTVEQADALGPERRHTNPQARFYPRRTVFPYFLHIIQFLRKGKLAGLVGLSPLDLPRVLSAHHQQVGKLGRGFRVEAVSADGKVIEAISHVRFPNVLGVQFHPEFDILWQGDAIYDLYYGDVSPLTVRAYMEKYPPSIAFHQNLWAWFGRALKESAELARGH